MKEKESQGRTKKVNSTTVTKSNPSEPQDNRSLTENTTAQETYLDKDTMTTAATLGKPLPAALTTQ